MGIFKKFKELIILGKYYEAHEVLEEYWHTIHTFLHIFHNGKKVGLFHTKLQR